LSPGHPNYPAYAQLNGMEQRIFIRKLIPEAVRQFKEKSLP
jgi:hypothetical protein